MNFFSPSIIATKSTKMRLGGEVFRDLDQDPQKSTLVQRVWAHGGRGETGVHHFHKMLREGGQPMVSFVVENEMEMCRKKIDKTDEARRSDSKGK